VNRGPITNRNRTRRLVTSDLATYDLIVSHPVRTT
jgi:hypothetical protein